MTVWNFDAELTEVQKKYPYKPRWDYPKDGTIFDEDKSVKWNREQVALKQAQWNAERKELNEKRIEEQNKVIDRIVKFICDEIDITEAAARRLWERADWDFNHLETLIDDYDYIRTVDNR